MALTMAEEGGRAWGVADLESGALKTWLHVLEDRERAERADEKALIFIKPGEVDENWVWNRLSDGPFPERIES